MHLAVIFIYMTMVRNNLYGYGIVSDWYRNILSWYGIYDRVQLVQTT